MRAHEGPRVLALEPPSIQRRATSSTHEIAQPLIIAALEQVVVPGDGQVDAKSTEQISDVCPKKWATFSARWASWRKRPGQVASAPLSGTALTVTGPLVSRSTITVISVARGSINHGPLRSPACARAAGVAESANSAAAVESESERVLTKGRAS